MIEVSTGNEILHTVKGKFEESKTALEFIDTLLADGYNMNEIFLYFTETGILKRLDNIIGGF